MAIGAGKYDDLCTRIREEALAKMAIVIILDGRNGSGFSIQAEDLMDIKNIPVLMHKMADEIERDLAVL